ncbi:MAG: RES domain-containing protein [Dietzia psychralcaliphila]
MRPEIAVCAHTGLALLPAGRQPVYRLAKPSYGVLNPPARGLSSSEDRSGWNRFDLPGEQTIYCASSPEGAYGELLGALKISGPYRASGYLDDPGEDDLYALIAQDWAELGARLSVPV